MTTAQLQHILAQTQRQNGFSFGFGGNQNSDPISQIIYTLTKVFGADKEQKTILGGLGVAGALFGVFTVGEMIKSFKPTFDGFTSFVQDTVFWWRPLSPSKVAPRIRTQKLAVEKLMDLIIDTEYLKKLTEGDTKIEVENIRDGAAHLSDEAKPLEKLLMTRSVNTNFDMVRRMFVAQMKLTMFQLDTFVLKNAPNIDKEFIKKTIAEIKENINAVITILEQKFDFKGFTDKDTKVELSTLKGLLTQLFNQLIGAFGVEAKDDSEKRHSW